ncbi:MAG: type II/IV secretion system ATPase subunit [Candidatus Aenigmatarchaeota archaeon]
MNLKVPKIKPKKIGVIPPRKAIRKMKRGYLAWLEKQKDDNKLYVQGVGVPWGFQGMPPPPQPPTEEDKPLDGVEILDAYSTMGRPLRIEEDTETLRNIRAEYPLIPSNPKKGEPVYAYANIKWDPSENQVVYEVVEPAITQYDVNLIEAVIKDLEERLDVDFTKLGEVQAKNILRNEIFDSIDILAPETDVGKKKVLAYYIQKDIIGLGKIETLMNDPNIEDISCDGILIPLYVYHRNPRLSSLRTNIMFKSKDELDNFISKLSQKANKTITIAEPLLDASLPDGSRVQATLGTDIARRGSNFTIRKFTEVPVTPTHMLKFKTFNSIQMAYLWLIVDNGQSILISGGSATGKTSTLNALSLFIRPSLKVVSIEDTAELRLPLPHWVPQVARTPLSTGGKVGDVSLFDLLKSSLRQRPDYIIVGEVRGKEAYVLFQQMATGHPSLATIHAATIPQLIDRLITPPISLPPSLIENVNVIIFLTLARFRGKYVRRVDTIMEITGVKNKLPTSNTIFKWKPITDSFDIVDKSVILKTVAKKLGVSEATVQDEVVRRKKILEWMLEKEIFDYREIARIISLYYTDPDKLLDMIIEI